MHKKGLMGLVAAGLMTMMVAGASGQVVDFETVPAATTYQNPANPPGSVVLMQNGISMSVELFNGGTFNMSEIVAPPDPFAFTGTQTLHTNNMSVKFDFSALPPVVAVKLEFSDQGGSEDFAINGAAPVNVPDLGSVVPPAGYNYSAAAGPGGIGTLSIDNTPGGPPITSLTIGGQEFAIDNVTVETGPPPEQGRFSYSVKFVCGVFEGDPQGATVEPGIYATEINIHNYRQEEVEIRKSVLMMVEQGEPVGREPNFVEVNGTDGIVLPPNTATMDDCQRIAEITGVDTSVLTIGYLGLETSQAVAVDAVHTSTGFDPGRFPPSIDVERIEGKEL